MYTHIHPLAYFPAPAAQEPVVRSPPPEPEEAPQARRSRSATDRFAFFRRAASAGPHASSPESPKDKMPNVSTKLPAANLSPRNAPDLNTLPDPRSPSPHPTAPGTPSGNHHPDLSNEVATLSAKLINAINHQTNLDDALQETRHELETARQRIRQLENDAKTHNDAVSQGMLVPRSDSEQKEQRMQHTINEERRKRNSAEREKKGMEQELENLTSQLFEEANKMVANARQEREAADKRADQLKAQLEETETLLASHQEQLAELKSVLQEVQSTPAEIVTTAATAPNSPIADKVSAKTFDFPTHQRNAHSVQSTFSPESPLHYPHLIHPIVRVDHSAFEDFLGLLRTTRNGASRQSSGSYVGLNVLGLGSKDPSSSQSSVVGADHSAPINSSSRSTSAQNTPVQGSHSPNISTDSTSSQATSLKDSRYYKRALTEDIEPTLRLDTAPALSWLARRTVLNAIMAGKLIIEPFPARHAFHSPAYACALCGEVRTSEDHLRRFRFRTSDSDEAQRYPLCNYCLTRVRTTCDFTTFLREARRGHMRNDSAGDCRASWEECIRLRERMFWARVGGGVVPTSAHLESSTESPTPRKSRESEREGDREEGSSARSDSDLASVRRADSGLSTGSEVADANPLSAVTTREEAPDAEAEQHDQPRPATSDKPSEPSKSPVREEHPLAQVESASDALDHDEADPAAPVSQTQGGTPETLQPANAAQPLHRRADSSWNPRMSTSATSPINLPNHQGAPADVPVAPLLSSSPSRLSTVPTAAAADPTKPAAAPRTPSKVASLATKFANLDNAAGSPPRSPRPTSSHSARGLRADSTSPVRASLDARRDSATSARASPSRSPVRDAKVPGSFA